VPGLASENACQALAFKLGFIPNHKCLDYEITATVPLPPEAALASITAAIDRAVENWPD
jgi:hypothetical protein